MTVPRWKRRLNRLDSSLRRWVSREGNREFVELLYESLLSRAPEPAALSEAVRKLGLGVLRRDGLRRELARSSEYRRVPRWRRRLNVLDTSIRRRANAESDEDVIRRMYDELLCRAPDPQALLEAARNLSVGNTRGGALRREIAASAEYRAVAPERERRNWLRAAPAPATDRSLAGDPPVEIWLELTTRCNVVPPCVMCGYASPDVAPRERRHMDPATWKGLLPLLRGARHVGLHGAGEPLLYPFLDDLLAALGPGPGVGFNSNGHLLGRDVGRRLVERGLGWISVSLDAATSGTYLRIRRRDDFEAVLSKIRTLREIRDAAGAAGPRIEINMTLMKLNLEEAPAFVDLAARVGADGVMFQEIQPGGAQQVTAPDGWLFDYREQELGPAGRRDEVLGEARRRASSRGLAFNCEILYARRGADRLPGVSPPAAAGPPAAACRNPWDMLLLDVEGNAFVCCIHKSNGILLGTLPRDSIDGIWNGRRARLVREAMFGAAAPSCCAGCYRTT